MNIDDVKRDLPDVRVYHEKTAKEYVCTVRGRLKPFAYVYCPALDCSWEFSWSQVTRALNNDRPLIA